MDFFLLLLFAGALIYLWRRTDELQAQIRQFEQIIDGLRFQLSRQSQGGVEAEVQDVEPEQASAPTVPDTNDVDTAESPATTPPIPEPVEQTLVPAMRAATPEPEISEPLYELDEAAPEEPKKPRFQFDFEDFFGRLLPIWAGGVALAVAGFFLVRYSIEQGLLGPEVRVALGFLFGGVLLSGAELAYRQEHRISDPRVRQALAGAGLATLYASFYLAGSQYDLIGSAIAFLGLAGVTGAAILLSFRFGLPSAILGLVGGFAAPMLIASEEANLPILALYLALVTGGLTYAGNKQGRSWLAIAALAGGLGWGALMLFSGITGFTDVLAFGGFIVVLGAIIPAFAKADDGTGLAASPILRAGAAVLAAIQMAAMVEQAGFSLLAWGLFGLLGAALAFFAWSEARLREASAFAALLALLMLAFWPDVEVNSFIAVGLAFTAIFAGVPLANIWRGAHRKIDAFQLGGFALGMIAVTYGHFSWNGNDMIMALVGLAIAILPALGSWILWPAREDNLSSAGIVTLTSATIGVAVAGLIATPLWAAPLVIAAVALGVIALGWAREDRGLTALAWAGSAIAFIALIVTKAFEPEFEMLFGYDHDLNVGRAILRWTAAALPFVALALRKPGTLLNQVAEIFGALLVYGVIAQFAPSSSLAWIAVGMAIALAFVDRERLAARLAFGFVALAWAAEPLVLWLLGASASVAAQPMLIAGDIGWREIGLQMLPLLAVAATLILRPAEVIKRQLTAVGAISGVVTLITGHMVFKQAFALETYEQFTALGLAERSVWQAILLAGGLAVAKLAAAKDWPKPVSIALYAATLAHFVTFTLILHNPLWSEQAVGSMPILNLLLPAYAIAIAAVIMLSRALASSDRLPRWPFDTALMILISAFALSELRHVFAGSILAGDPVGQTEDLLRSVLGIVLAIGFLMWGARVETRSWRIGSLVLMLAAVLKVFLVDASELDGLVRVASFVALGFSLIGIGWFYTRQLAGVKTRAA